MSFLQKLARICSQISLIILIKPIKWGIPKANLPLLLNLQVENEIIFIFLKRFSMMLWTFIYLVDYVQMSIDKMKSSDFYNLIVTFITKNIRGEAIRTHTFVCRRYQWGLSLLPCFYKIEYRELTSPVLPKFRSENDELVYCNVLGSLGHWSQRSNRSLRASPIKSSLGIPNNKHSLAGHSTP